MAKKKQSFIPTKAHTKNLRQTTDIGKEMRDVKKVKANTLKVNSELKTLIPPLTDEERQLLEKSILKEGIRESVIIWNDYVIDGHNRQEIAGKHGLLIPIQEKEFDSIEDVKDWMINNQLGKRNLSKEQKSYLRGLQYKSEKKSKSDNLKPPKAQNGPLAETTAERIAKQHNVSKNTIKRDEQFSNAIDKISNLELRQKILSGKSSITKGEVQILGKSSIDKVNVKTEGALKKKIEAIKKEDSASKAKNIKKTVSKAQKGTIKIPSTLMAKVEEKLKDKQSKIN